MNPISEPQAKDIHTAWGNRNGGIVQSFKVTAKDVGRKKPNYCGQENSSYTFTSEDIGKIVIVQHVAGETNWYFRSPTWVGGPN